MRTFPRFIGSLFASAALLGLSGCSLVFHPADRIDADGDGFFAVGDLAELDGRTVEDMDQAQLDCDDDNDDVFPGAAELCDGLDNDCSRFEEGVDAGLSRQEQDQDGDGFSPCGFIDGDGVTEQQDCNDDPDDFGFMQAPDHAEVCGIPLATGVTSYNGPDPNRISIGLDDDCDPTNNDPLEIDADKDGHLRCQRVSLEQLHGLEVGDGIDVAGFEEPDCVDENDGVYPTVDAAAESCVPGLENTFTSICRDPDDLTPGQRDALFETWYPDVDRDGDGDQDETTWETQLCLGQFPDGYVEAIGNDRANWIQEDGTSQTQADDCDDLNPSLHRLDHDDDGFFSCGAPDTRVNPDFVAGGVDSDNTAADRVAEAFPGGVESCDAVDNDLDGRIDEDFDGDADQSYSDPNSPGGTDGCADTYGSAVDCDDGDAGANTLDQDGDGDTTCAGDCNDFDPAVSYEDQDGDTYFTCGTNPDCDDTNQLLYPADLDGDGFLACPSGTTPADCDDDPASATAPNTWPGNGTQCDGIADSNCDGVADPLETDADSDGYIECNDTIAALIGGLSGGGDCNDNDPGLTPADGDLDTYSTCSGDCDDSEPAAYPAAQMLCDGVTDNDCNGVLDANEADSDSDGSTPCAGDCDDFDPTVEGLDLDGDGFTTCEDDCDDSVATGAGLNPGVDADGDGWDVCGAGGVPADCDDGDATENWNDVDGDGASTCSSVPDCDDNDATLNQADGDNDNESTCDGDCNDALGSVNSTASESNNGIDDDCDGIADEGLVLAGDIVIVEMMIGTDPLTGDAFGEYIEILNDSGTTIDLRGWEVEVATTGGGTTSFFFPSDSDPTSSLDFADGTRAVLARANSANAYGSSIATFVWSATAFSNNGGTITLSAPTAGASFVPIDEVTWLGSGCTANCDSSSLNPTYGNAPASGSFWRPGFAMGLKPSVESGANPATANDSPDSWCEEQTPLGTSDYGSPGVQVTTQALFGGSGC